MLFVFLSVSISSFICEVDSKWITLHWLFNTKNKYSSINLHRTVLPWQIILIYDSEPDIYFIILSSSNDFISLKMLIYCLNESKKSWLLFICLFCNFFLFICGEDACKKITLHELCNKTAIWDAIKVHVKNLRWNILFIDGKELNIYFIILSNYYYLKGI